MKRNMKVFVTVCTAGLLAAGVVALQLNAAESKEDPIKEVMKKYHKAPKGTDTIAKKAQDGTATKEELKGLVEGYKIIAKEKAPKGEAASWKEKTGKLLVAAQALQKGAPDSAAQFKEAVNCKACHSVHKPD